MKVESVSLSLIKLKELGKKKKKQQQKKSPINEKYFLLKVVGCAA